MKFGDSLRLTFNFQNEMRSQMTPTVPAESKPADKQAGREEDDNTDSSVPLQTERIEMRPFVPRITFDSSN